MGKTIIAFVAGLAVAALAFSLVDREPANTSLDRSGSILSPERVDTSDDPETESTSREVVPNESVTATGPAGREMQDASVDESVLNERPPPELPIVLPSEFDYLAEPSEQLNIHHTLEREPYDPNWAPAMEAEIAQFLVENPEIVETYGYPTLTCRTTRCEAAFVAYGLDPALGLDDFDLEWLEGSGLSDFEIRRIGIGEHFAGLIWEFFEKPGFEQFDNINGYPSAQIRPGDGVTTILWHLNDTSRPRRDYLPGASSSLSRDR